MNKLPVLPSLLVILGWCVACGSNQSSTSTPTPTPIPSNGYLFGERLGADVYMQPGPPTYTFPAWSGTVPNIQIDEVMQFSSTVNPEGADIYQGTTQVVYDQVTGPVAGKQVIVYSYTNDYYIQPLTSTTINISSNSTWIAPASAGQIAALLVSQSYSPPNTTTTLPSVDGINVFALVMATVNPSQFAFSEYAIPTANSSPFDIVTGPDSALWFTENNTDKIGRVTTSGMISDYAVPTAAAAPSGIATGPDGALWFTEANANQIGRVTTSGQFTEYSIPTAGAGPSDITPGSDGALWFTEYQANQIGRITTSGMVTEYPVPTSGSGPSGIVAGPDGALWFTESYGYKIAKITISGQLTEYPIPNSLGFVPAPSEIIVGADGALWFEGAPAGLGRITTAGDMTLWNISWNNIAVGPDQKMWFAGYTGSFGVVGQFNETQQLSSFNIPAPAASGEPGEIITGPDGALWFLDSANYIVRFGPTNSTSQAQLSPGKN